MYERAAEEGEQRDIMLRSGGKAKSWRKMRERLEEMLSDPD